MALLGCYRGLVVRQLGWKCRQGQLSQRMGGSMGAVPWFSRQALTRNLRDAAGIYVISGACKAKSSSLRPFGPEIM